MRDICRLETILIRPIFIYQVYSYRFLFLFLIFSHGPCFLYNFSGTNNGNEQCVKLLFNRPYKFFRFHPEVLGLTSTNCVMALTVEVILIKFGCYLLGIGSEIHFLDFCSYSGYKFCILIACLAAGIFGNTVKYCVFAYSILAYGFFLVINFDRKFIPIFIDSLFTTRPCSRKC